MSSRPNCYIDRKLHAKYLMVILFTTEHQRLEWYVSLNCLIFCRRRASYDIEVVVGGGACYSYGWLEISLSRLLF